MDPHEIVEALRKATLTPEDIRVVPVMREALADVVEKVARQQAEERAAAREANLARWIPIWEASLEAIEAREAAEPREGARDIDA